MAGIWGRDRERRLHRLGIWGGLLLALLVHLYILFAPSVSYKPVLERAKFKRVLVAQPYRPRDPEPPPPKLVKKPKPQKDKKLLPKKVKKADKPQPHLAPTIAETVMGSESPKGSATEGKTKKSDAMQKHVVESATPSVRGGETSKGSSAMKKGLEVEADKAQDVGKWQELMAQLEAQHDGIVEEKERIISEQDRVLVAEEDEPEGFLEDSRIRMKVTTYPISSFDNNHPSIDYPDLSLRESQLQSGICRVYFRVWTDDRGRITKEQLKAPPPGAARETYKVFIDKVMEEVRFWDLPRQKGEVHVDVLFEIE